MSVTLSSLFGSQKSCILLWKYKVECVEIICRFSKYLTCRSPLYIRLPVVTSGRPQMKVDTMNTTFHPGCEITCFAAF